jgi:hypothetical protein
LKILKLYPKLGGGGGGSRSASLAGFPSVLLAGNRKEFGRVIYITIAKIPINAIIIIVFAPEVVPSLLQLSSVHSSCDCRKIDKSRLIIASWLKTHSHGSSDIV